MTETEPKRTPANQNPWYVLMTLYGEQEGGSFDAALHEKNREAWNAWAASILPDPVGDDHSAKGATLPHRAVWGLRFNQIKKQHEAEMLRRNEAGFAYPGLPDLLSPSKIDFRAVDFFDDFRADAFVFPVFVDFGFAAFGGAAGFDRATFVGGAYFNSSKFDEDAMFSSSKFSTAASFRSSIFDGAARFEFATFGDIALFGGARFNGTAWFHSVSFSGDADFTTAIFIRDLGFALSTFSGVASFNSTTIEGHAIFRSATFNSFAHFPEAHFGTPGTDYAATFSDCQFLKPTNFRNSVFHSQYPDLSGAVLHDKTEFTAKPENWPLSTAQSAEDAKASCARIRHAIAKQGLPEEEHFFYRREMGFACQIGPVWQRLPYRLFGLLSDFGYSIQRPVEALLLLWVWPAVLFFCHAQTGRLADSPEIGRALALSFPNIFNFLGFHRTFFAPDVLQRLPAALQVLSGFQTLAGVALLFFLGLGLRTRFRLR